jgi:hypothetical protein
MSTSSAAAIARLHAVLAAAASSNNNNPTAATMAANSAYASTAAAAATASSSTTNTTAAPSRSSTTSSSSATTDKDKKKKDRSEEQEDDEEDITYTPYTPAKLKFGKPHPDKVVENATLAAVAPPDIIYNMVMPASIIHEGKLSNLQLEAIVYGCQRHMVDLPKAKISNEENNTPVPPTHAAVKSEKKMGAVKSEKKVGLSYQQQQQQVKHESKPQADSPALSPCPPSSSGIGDGSTPVAAAKKMEPPSYRAGFLLGDGAGMVSLSLLYLNIIVLTFAFHTSF